MVSEWNRYSFEPARCAWRRPSQTVSMCCQLHCHSCILILPQVGYHNDRGIVPLAMEEMFRRIHGNKDSNVQFQVQQLDHSR